ncbi:lipopolysaccharide biosynthesis protein [Candidatus Marithrix sp. Canyon 246]|uniref:lipopolysaccharide biosynthesis protein n=1 Tax=Candidatus Marithrix sp. Canyon 246 TaxID=1827136 RepID=UPI00084A18A9|nr:lipopolysaccharide biosynthesis protein [Candidatus Marithrix sp. Canyon 246]
MKNLKQSVIKGIAWRSTVDISNLILQIVFTAILARLLTPADFGIVVMALLFIRFIKMMTQIGFGTAIIQSQDITQAQISAIFLIQISIACFISVFCYLSAPLAANFFNQPKLTELIHLLTWVVLINSFAFPQIILQKNMQFAGTSILEIIAMIISNTIGIIMAFKGYGIWSLVFRQMTQAIIFSTGIWIIAKWIPIKPQFTGIKKIFNFGLNMYGSNIFYYFSQNLAAIIIGKFIGAETLGAFNIAYNLAIVPAQKVQSILTTVLTPAFSTVQAKLDQLRKNFFISLFSLGIVFIPLMIGLSAVAENFVLVVYGEKWQSAGMFLTLLAIVGLFKGIEHLLRSVILAKGGAATIFHITIIETTASLLLLSLGSYFFEVIGLIIAYITVSLISFTLTTIAAQNTIKDNTLLFRTTTRTFFAAGIMFAVITLGYYTLIESHSITTLCTQIILGGSIYIVFRIKLLTKEEQSLINKMPLAPILLLTHKK